VKLQVQRQCNSCSDYTRSPSSPTLAIQFHRPPTVHRKKLGSHSCAATATRGPAPPSPLLQPELEAPSCFSVSTTPASFMSACNDAFSSFDIALPAIDILRSAGISFGLKPSASNLLFCR